jgi:hypothetical protein
MFTDEEYQKLIDRAPAYNIISDLNNILQNNKYTSSRHKKDIKEFLTNKYPRTAAFLYVLPLNQTPRLINIKQPLVRAIILWRLEIGK